MYLLSHDLLRAATFGFYVCWLTVFPMSGALLEAPEWMLWFLVPHALGLLACGWKLPLSALRPLAIAGTATCVTASVLYVPVGAHGAPWVLLLLGLAATPLSIQQGLLLRDCAQPTLHAALGLATGNLLAMAVTLATLPAIIVLPLVSLPLLLVLAFAWTSSQKTNTPPPENDSLPSAQRGYLPFILFFQIVSGLMYGGLYPDHAMHTETRGIELLPYVGGALIAARLFPGNRDRILLFGTLAALLAFAAWQLLPVPWGVHLAMMTMLLAAGLVDLFLLAWVLSLTHTVRAYGIGVGVLCSGIVLGHWLAAAIGERTEVIGFSGLIALNIAALVLYLPWRGSPASASVQAPEPAFSLPPGQGVQHTSPTRPQGLPPRLAALLSEQEQQVLQLARGNQTYRQIGATLSISESSVKTYMQRIFRKTGLVRRHQINDMIEFWWLERPDANAALIPPASAPATSSSGQARDESDESCERG